MTARSLSMILSLAFLTASEVRAASEPLTLTLRDASGKTCVFTPNSNGLGKSQRPGVNIEATGDMNCSNGGDPYGPGMVIGGPSTWTVTLPWRIGQVRTLRWFAYPAETCEVSAFPINGQPEGSMVVRGETTCSGIGTQIGQPPAAACINSHEATFTPSASGGYVVGIDCRRGTIRKTDSRTLVVSPPA